MARMSLLTHLWFSNEGSSRGGTILRMVACALLIMPGAEFLPGSRAINFCVLLVVSYLLERRGTHAAVWASIALLWRAWTYADVAPFAIFSAVLGLIILGLAIARMVQERRGGAL